MSKSTRTRDDKSTTSRMIYPMKLSWSLAAMSLLLAGTCRGQVTQAEKPAAPVNRAADEKAIREAGAAFARAYDAGDVKAIGAMFTEDAEVIDEDGRVIQGREPIAALFASDFEANPGETIEINVESIRFLGPDTAVEDGRTKVLPARSRAKVITEIASPQSGRYTVLYVREAGRWLQASVREHPDKEVTPHERLEPLAWMVGDWVDEGSDSVVLTAARWSEDGNFLLRDFTIQIRGKPAMKGTQRIGWDPLTRQIKSWVFDSEGGHGEAYWAHDHDRWIVKASGVHPDGRTASATQIYTVVNRDLVRWKSIDRTSGDQLEPEISEFVMVRKPPQPR
jgi:uncharacterized protein (TIGR02246 family)